MFDYKFELIEVIKNNKYTFSICMEWQLLENIMQRETHLVRLFEFYFQEEVS